MNIIQEAVDPKEDNKEPKPFQYLYQELLTELLKSVTNTKQRVQHHYKVQIEKIFNSKGFFNMSKPSLRKW